MRNKAKSDKNLKKVQKEIEDIGVIMPIVDYSDELDVGIMKDGTFIDCLQIISKDLNNVDDLTSKLDCAAYDKLYSTYADSLKIVSSYFPVDTSSQISYFRKILERTENPVYRAEIEDEIRKCEIINKEMLNREFLLFFYADSIGDYNEKYIRITSTYSNGKRLFETISKEKKKRHFNLLANKNLNF